VTAAPTEPFRALTGMRDVLPPEAARRRALLARFAEAAERAGYAEVAVPVLEELGVFERMGEATDVVAKEMYDFEVVSAPDPKKYNATGGEKIKDGAPWVVVFDNFLTDAEVHDLIRGGEIEGYERSTDQGEKSDLGEQAKVVSQTRTSANAWCMHKCERLAGVQSATKKIEEITG
jgi:hypothetical protein